MKSLNVYSGKNAIINYLNPDFGPYVPLVELPESINPYHKYNVRIFAKLMNTLPLYNIKSLPAFNMLAEAGKRGELKDIETLIENSSGNTVYSLSIIGRLLGILKTIAIVSNEVSKGKLNLLRLFGVNIRVNKEPICPDPNDKTSGIYKAKIWARENGWFNPGQYDNPDNPEAHNKWTGEQIWQQTNGKISVFCTGLGTTGTMMGTGSFLKKKNASIRTVGVVRKPNNPVPGPRTRHLLSQIAFKWTDVVDHIEEVGTSDAYELSLSLIRNGLLVGPSSGFNLKGLFYFLDQLIQTGELKHLQHDFKEIISVFVACDSPFPYVEDYFKYLTESHFPDIENKELLNHSPDEPQLKENEIQPAPYEIAVKTAYHLIFSGSPDLVWQLLKRGKNIPTHPNTITIDLRDSKKYQTSHIPGAENIPFEKINKNYVYYQKKWKGLTLLFFCNQGEISNHVTNRFRQNQIEAFSIKNGLIGWSKADLPRWQPQSCKIKAFHQ